MSETGDVHLSDHPHLPSFGHYYHRDTPFTPTFLHTGPPSRPLKYLHPNVVQTFRPKQKVPLPYPPPVGSVLPETYTEVFGPPDLPSLSDPDDPRPFPVWTRIKVKDTLTTGV